jgi:hypothetical protein
MATSLTDTTLGTPLGWGTTVGVVSGPVWPGNASANGAIFMNNGSVQIAICPAQVNQGTLGVYSGFAAGVASIGGPGCKNLNPGDVFIIDTLQCRGAFNGVAGGPGGQLTVWSF